MSRGGPTPRGFLDRDFITTPEDLLFCVIGGVHPPYRVIAYLKYLPTPRGKWGKTTRYSRTMKNYTIPSLLENLTILATKHPQYIYKTQVLNTKISAVPKESIIKHHMPEEKLIELYHTDHRDSLQSRVVQLVSLLSHRTAIPRECFGITGSILTDIHHPDFSDIDLIVYGMRNGWKIRQYLQNAFQNNEQPFTRHSQETYHQLLSRWSQRYPLTLLEAKLIYARRWNYGFFHDTPFSIHPVRPRAEIVYQYGEQHFHPIQMIEGTATIVEVEQSLFLPAIYEITDFASIEKDTDVFVHQIVSFNGLYNGIYEVGEKIHVRGKLEKVVDKHRQRIYHRILIGSLLAKGQDYIKPWVDKDH